MLSKKETFEVGSTTAIGNLKHQDYTRVTEMQVLLKTLITGDGVEGYIKKFNMREDDELFAQRILFTQVVTPSICAKLRNPSQKIAGVKPIVKDVIFKEANEQKQKDIWDLINNFYGEKDVDGYLKERLLSQLMDNDPNAFILLTFDTFDNVREKPFVYATEISCFDAVNFEYRNNILQWLICKREITYETNKKDKDGNSRFATGDLFITYGDSTQVQFSQIDLELKGATEIPMMILIHPETKMETLPEEAAFNVPYLYRVDKKKAFEVTFYDTKAPFVPAFRVGVMPDELTDGRTCVSTIHPAIPYLMKVINAGSEHDMTIALHAFPQKVSYAPRCKGTKNHPCHDGRTGPAGEGICNVCNGSGYVIHKSSQDSIIMTLPKRPEEITDLKKMVAYIELPMDIVKWLDEYMEKLEEKCMTSRYNSDRFVKQTVAETATKNNIDMQSVYDALQPVADAYSYWWVYIVRLEVAFNSLGTKDSVTVIHKFPRNFKFESVADLLAQLQAADAAHASEPVKQQLNDDLANLLYIDNQDALKRISIKRKFNPFDGKSDDMILYIFSNNLTSNYNKTLYIFFKDIFEELENQYSATNSSFYDLTYEKQKEAIATQVAIFQAVLDEEAPAPVVVPQNPFSGN